MSRTGFKEFINRGVLPLVGRGKELRVLTEAFNGLLEGEPRSVWINGVAGAGKSRLVEELKSRVRDNASRALVVHAKWFEGHNGEFAPLSTALEILRPALSAPVAARIYRDGVVSSIEAAIETMQTASRRYPIVLVLDDLHYLESSGELEKFIGALEQIPLLLIATARPTDNPAVRALRLALSGAIPPVDLEIGALDDASVSEVVSVLFGVQPSEKMLRQIVSLCNGLPLTLREVLREIIAMNILAEGPPGVWNLHNDPLASDQLRVIGDRVHGFSGRLASLPEPQRAMLAIAAYLGEQFNRDLLRALCERTIGWNAEAFEQLILDGLIAIATPAMRFSSGDFDNRTCYAFSHTLLWNAAEALSLQQLPERRELAALTFAALSHGTGELYSISALQKLNSDDIPADQLPAVFDWLAAVGRRLSPIYSELFVALCQNVLEPFRNSASMSEAVLLEQYLRVLTVYGDHLYLSGLRKQLGAVATEIASLLDKRAGTPPQDAPERILRIEAAVVVWHDAYLRNDPDGSKGYLDEMLKFLPPPEKQTDRELRGAAEAIRLRAQYSFSRGDFAEMLDVVTPYIGELDRMRAETLNELFKVSLYAMMQAGRMDEAGEMVAAGLRLRKEADVYTEYQLLLHGANYARRKSDIVHLRQYATELRSLADRYAPYRNMSPNYYHLPYVSAIDGDVAALEQLEHEFRTIPISPRSTPVQTTLAKQQFLFAWNLLCQPERAMQFADELRGDYETMTLHQRIRIVEEHLRAVLDACDQPTIAEVSDRVRSLAEQIGGGYVNPETSDWRELHLLLALANHALDDAQDGTADELQRMISMMQPADISPSDLIRAARTLFTCAVNVPKAKRALSDAAMSAVELSIGSALERTAPGLGHYHLDKLAEVLPKTRLSKFRQQLGPDPRKQRQEDESAGSKDSGTQTGTKLLRTFGALRIEGAGESGAKLESKTRTLVAALCVCRLGRSRDLGELTRDRLADLLWPDMDIDRAVNNLHATLSYARRFLGAADSVAQQDGVYQLDEQFPVDALEFLEVVDRGNKLYGEGVYFGAAVAYRRAADIAVGDFLEGMYTEWVDNMRESLRSKLSTALERLISIEADRENFDAVPTLAERLLALDDLHDGAYEALIRSAAVRGARREAFSYYKRYQTALDAYGAGPTRRITELMKQVREGEEVSVDE